MRSARQTAYLEAMGIPLWVMKQTGAEVATGAGGLRIGPGSGKILLICAADDDSAGKLAADISRALPEQPVWAWPAGHDGGCSAAQLVDEHLFTDVLVFGAECARAVFGSPLPELVGQARILVVPAMDELSNQPAARRSLWQCLCVSKLTAV